MMPPLKLFNGIFSEDYEFLPQNMMPTKYLNSSFEDFGDITMAYNDENLCILTELLTVQLKKICEIYGEKFIFTEPMLYFQPRSEYFKNRVGFKVGMMEKEVFEDRKKK